MLLGCLVADLFPLERHKKQIGRTNTVNEVSVCRCHLLVFLLELHNKNKCLEMTLELHCSTELPLDLCTAGLDVLQLNQSMDDGSNGDAQTYNLLLSISSTRADSALVNFFEAKHTLVCSTPDTWPHHEPYCLQTSFFDSYRSPLLLVDLENL